MTGQCDSVFASSTASELGDRSRLSPDTSFCDSPESSRVNHWPDQTSDSVRDGFPGTVDAASISHGSDLDTRSAPGSQSVAVNGSDPSDVHISALAAVSHYASAMDNELSLPPTPEVVNAVMERDGVIRRGSSSGRRNAQPSSSSPPTELYVPDSEMSDALGDLSAPDPFETSDDVDMEAIVHHLIHTTAGHNISTIEQDSDSDYDDNMVMDYESTMLRDMSTPSTPRDDDPDDTRKFYLDDDDDGYTECPQLRWSGSPLSDVDFDDFYRSFDYESSSQMMDTAIPSAQDDATFSSDHEGAAGDEANDAGLHFLAATVHGTSMTPCHVF